MNDILARQFSYDYCCTKEEVESEKNIFTVFSPDERRRVFMEKDNFFKAACVNGKILASGDGMIMPWVRERLSESRGAWFMEAEKLRELDRKLIEYGHRIDEAHIFFTGEEKSLCDTSGYEIEICRGKEIERFRGDGRFDEAYAFLDHPKDEIGIAAVKNGEIVGMAGATGDSPDMWQIGINVMPGFEGRGIGTMLVTLLKNEILDLGKLPFYGTAMSHIASQRVALGAGFMPAWTELTCEKL